MSGKSYISINNKTGKGKQHRLIMEEYLGRKLTKDEVVHHINEDKQDNRIENLQVMDKKEHLVFHGLKRDNSHNIKKAKHNMKRINVFFTQEQVDYLANHTELSLSENVRRAMDDYIDTLRSWDACASASKIIKNTKDGRNTNTKA